MEQRGIFPIARAVDQCFLTVLSSLPSTLLTLMIVSI
jgi:hypothetical protein